MLFPALHVLQVFDLYNSTQHSADQGDTSACIFRGLATWATAAGEKSFATFSPTAPRAKKMLLF
ncbi:hypothetical protein CHLRE_04g226301v5 [Chlamydomonas reinhardtii]|uniref:Uncharacterized protein n=1 Tax=Chlamydomonas reinhardtii TaxID=3055 RepID=A0A2K3DUM9_CHLRE|nr:uncharacterized protein CHLRE_04g226301v5 [Chlamydomonas reinhardtii]PNW84239.1 hypothetical protein CHLRE_04g226301v5 [Chlamydomonas reinhardtii]